MARNETPHEYQTDADPASAAIRWDRDVTSVAPS
jgi:hypothetical protein